MPEEPYKADQVMSICQRLRDQEDFQARRRANENRTLLRFRRHYSAIPGISLQLEDQRPDLEVHAERYNNALDNSDIKIQAAAKKEASKDNVQRVENFCYTLWYDWARRKTSHLYAPHRRAIDQQTSYGCGIRHLDYSPELRAKITGMQIGDPEEMRRIISADEDGFRFEGNPYAMECPDLAATFWEDDLSVFCEIGEKKVSELLDNADLIAEYPELLTSETMVEGEVSNATVRTYHLETRNYIYDVIEAGNDGHMIEYRPNLIGRPWYTLAPGNLTSARSVEDAFQPLIGALYPLVEKLQLIGTLLASAGMQTGRNQWQEVAVGAAVVNHIDWMAMPADTRPAVRADLTDEMLQKPRDGYRWEIMPIPPMTELRALQDQTQSDIERYGFPAVLDPSGMGAQATSGYDRNRMIEGAVTYLGPPLDNIASSARELFLMALDGVKELGVTVAIPVLNRSKGESMRLLQLDTIRPEDCKDLDLAVSFVAIPATVEFQQQEADSRELDAGRMSRRTYMGRRYDDPVEEEKNIFLDTVSELEKAKALEIVQQVINEQTAAIAAGLQADMNIPLPPAPLPDERPVGGAEPGLGAPIIPPEQSQPGDMGMPPSMGTELVATAPQGGP